MNGAPAIGTVLLGKYRVEEILGIGGMGIVVRALHLDLERPVAIKFLLPNMVENAAVVQRFLREAQASGRLRGEHAVKVIDVGRMPDGVPFMIMEHLVGADLGHVLKTYGSHPPPVACDLMLQICEGMAEAHALGIVHRDVKPSNFFVTRRPDGSALVKILDFGISKVPVEAMANLTATQAMVGTPAYMAPEQMRAASAVDARGDLWSMGVVLYQLLTSALPFDGDSYPALCLKVAMEAPAPISVALPPGLVEVVLRCLEKQPEHRYQSVAQLAYALAPYCSDPAAAMATAERTTRILEAPRGGRAPTLSSDAVATGQLVPPSGHRSDIRAYPSSVSGGAGQLASASQLEAMGFSAQHPSNPSNPSNPSMPSMPTMPSNPSVPSNPFLVSSPMMSPELSAVMGRQPARRKGRMAVYLGGLAAVVALGVGLGIFAAGRDDETPIQPAAGGAAEAPSTTDSIGAPAAATTGATGSDSAPATTPADEVQATSATVAAPAESSSAGATGQSSAPAATDPASATPTSGASATPAGATKPEPSATTAEATNPEAKPDGKPDAKPEGPASPTDDKPASAATSKPDAKPDASKPEPSTSKAVRKDPVRQKPRTKKNTKDKLFDSRE